MGSVEPAVTPAVGSWSGGRLAMVIVAILQQEWLRFGECWQSARRKRVGM